MVEPTNCQKEGLVIQSTVPLVHEGYVPIQVRNYGTTDIQVAKAQTIPELHCDVS